jgi:hypothetical protein
VEEDAGGVGATGKRRRGKENSLAADMSSPRVGIVDDGVTTVCGTEEGACSTGGEDGLHALFFTGLMFRVASAR